MKRKILILVLVVITNSAFSQTENYKVTFEKFETNYNAEKYEEIFNIFSPGMQGYLPLENTKQFLSGLKKQAGKIIDKEFIGDEGETGAIYKTQFERSVLGVYIELDKENKISSLLIKPYEESKEIENASINALDDYPKNIAEIIFSKSKSLPNNSQLSIALIQNGKTEFYGIKRDSETIKQIENEDKVFEIGSITKVFTSTVLAALVEEDKIKLTDEINSFYPFDFKVDIELTFKNLANHTSGMTRLPENIDLTNTTNPYKSYGKKEIEEYLRNLMKLENEPMKTYAYSNLGAGLLGYTLGISQKTTFQELLQNKIFDKYNMNSSFTTSQNIENKLVKGIDKNGEIVSNWDFDALFGAGGILSTTKDLSKFVNGQFNPENKELTLTRKPTFDIDENMKIGLGWHILKTEDNKNLYWHNGGTGGYSSFLVFNLEYKTAVIILSNVSDINEVIDNLGFELIKIAEK